MRLKLPFSHLLHDHEELANTITHGLGVVLGIGFVPVLITWAVLFGEARHVWGVSIFSASLLALYLFSTLYHAFHTPKIKKLFHILDHIGIYFLIAGSYTPFLLWFLESGESILFLSIIWGIALVGSALKLFFTGKFRIISTLAYVGMGWMIVFFGEPVFSALSTPAIIWLVIGGSAYTLGVIFFLWKNLRFSHAIWHVFVLVGSTSHFISVFYSI
jgi:hemolysin III